MKTATYYKRKPFAFVEDVRAAKKHICKVCGKIINVGTTYWRKKGMTEKGLFYTFDYCDPCFSTCNE